MTAIAWDGTTLAVDRATFGADQMMECCKLHIIYKKDTPMMYASCGSTYNINQIVRWFENGCEGKPEIDKEADTIGASFGIMVDGWGTAWTVFGNGTLERIIPPFAADGAATPFLYGALAAGASADKAVQLAVQMRGDAGIGVDAFEWKGLSSIELRMAAIAHFKKSILKGERS